MPNTQRTQSVINTKGEFGGFTGSTFKGINAHDTVPVLVRAIPKDIYEAFVRKYSLPLIEEYAKLREVTSLDDLAFMVALDKAIRDQLEYVDDPTIPFTDELLQHMRTENGYSLSAEQYAEIASSILPLSKTTTMQNRANSYLSGPEEDENTLTLVKSADNYPDRVSPVFVDEVLVSEQPYRTFVANKTLYIIIDEGFNEKVVKDKEARLEFLRIVTKSLLTSYNIPSVSANEWYREYVSSLIKVTVDTLNT